MPQSLLQTINNSDTQRTLQVAEIVGRDLLVLAFSEAGFSSTDAESLADATTSEAIRSLEIEKQSGNETLKLIDIIETRMDAEINANETFKAGVLAADSVVEAGTELFGSSPDQGRAGLSLVLSLALLLGLAKLEGRYDWKTGEGYIALAEGVPSGFTDSLRVISEAVAKRLQQQPGNGVPPVDGPGRNAPTGAQSFGDTRLDPPSNLTSRAKPSEPHQVHSLARSEADALAKTLIERFASRHDLAELHSADPATLFLSKDDILGPGGSRQQSNADTRLFSLGAGIQPGEDDRYIVTLRIQTPRYLKTKIWRQIKEFYRERYGAAVSLRWTAPVELMASNPEGDWHPWRGPRDRLRVGSPINIAGGCIGTVGLFVKDRTSYFALTMGHVLADCHEDTTGRDVYFEPQPLAAIRSHSIGQVDLVELCPRISMGNRSAAQPQHALLDLGVVRLHDTIRPLHETGMRFGARTFSSSVHKLDIHVDSGASMLKSAARSRETCGTITAFNVGLEAIDRVRGGVVRIEGAVEIELDSPDHVVPGDSGALVCLDRAGTLVPFGLCVAGARRSKIRRSDGPNRSAAYVLPLTSLLERIGDPEIC